MKLIVGLKKRKDLKRKAEDLRKLIKQHSAISSVEKPEYPDQKKQVSDWMQAHSDILKEYSKLSIAIQHTNLQTLTTIELDGKHVEKSIAEWILRRRDLAAEELLAWQCLTDRNIKEGMATGPSGNQIEVTIQRFFDPKERDHKVSIYKSESSIIDSHLEVVNAVTDIIGYD